MISADETAADLILPVLAAFGGTERIGSVKTFMREAIRIRRDGSGRVLATDRILTFRAAGGRVHIETAPVDDCRSDRRETPGDSGAHAIAARALREVSREPRIVLTHLRERRHEARRSSGGGVEIELLDERLLYRFAARSRLCLERVDLASRAATSYMDWRLVGGIASPFREVTGRDGGAAIVEECVAGLAYDLPLPESLFRSQ